MVSNSFVTVSNCLLSDGYFVIRSAYIFYKLVSLNLLKLEICVCVWSVHSINVEENVRIATIITAAYVTCAIDVAAISQRSQKQTNKPQKIFLTLSFLVEPIMLGKFQPKYILLAP